MRRRALILVAILSVTAAIAGWSRIKTHQPATVEVAKVLRGAITASFTADGVVKGKTVDLAPRMMGRIKAISVKEGQRVRPGQLLLQIDDQELLAGIREADAAVAAARSLLAQAESAFTLARQQAAVRETQAVAQLRVAQAQLRQVSAGARDQEIAQADQQVRVTAANLASAEQAVRRARDLHAAGGLARAELDDLEARHAVASAQHRAAIEALALLRAGARSEDRDVARAQVEAAQAQLDAVRIAGREVLLREADVATARARVAQANAASQRARALLPDVSVVAPFDGVISRIPVEAGQIASPALPAITMVDLRNLWVSADLADEDAAKVRRGQEVVITVPAFPGRRFRGRIKELAPQAELKPLVTVQTRILRMEVALIDGADVLRPGLEVDVEGQGTVVASALMVPSDAVVFRDNRSSVFVVRDGTVTTREVRIGYSAFDVTEILTGLREGDVVVVAGKEGLTDGRRVRVARPPGR